MASSALTRTNGSLDSVSLMTTRSSSVSFRSRRTSCSRTRRSAHSTYGSFRPAMDSPAFFRAIPFRISFISPTFTAQPANSSSTGAMSCRNSS